MSQDVVSRPDSRWWWGIDPDGSFCRWLVTDDIDHIGEDEHAHRRNGRGRFYWPCRTLRQARRKIAQTQAQRQAMNERRVRRGFEPRPWRDLVIVDAAFGDPRTWPQEPPFRLARWVLDHWYGYNQPPFPTHFCNWCAAKDCDPAPCGCAHHTAWRVNISDKEVTS